MQIPGTASQTTTTAATTTPVQPLASPTATASQAGNVVMVITIKYVSFTYIVCVYIILTCSDYRATKIIYYSFF